MSWNKSISHEPKAKKNLPYKIPLAVFLFLLIGLVVVCLFLSSYGTHTRAGKNDSLLGRIPVQRDINCKIKQRQLSSDPNLLYKSASNPTNIEFEQIRVLPQVQSFSKPPEPLQVSQFEHSTDQIISMTVNTEGPIAPIPYEGNMDDDFLRSLETEIQITDGDSESLKKAKRNVIEARKAIKQLLAEGISVREALEEHRNQCNFNYDMRTAVQIEAQKLYDAGDIKGAREFVVKMNVALDQFGLDLVDFPMSAEERRKESWLKHESSK